MNLDLEPRRMMSANICINRVYLWLPLV